MRLYNATSRTPVASNGYNWSPEKAYLPKVIEHQSAQDRKRDHSQDTPQKIPLSLQTLNTATSVDSKNTALDTVHGKSNKTYPDASGSQCFSSVFNQDPSKTEWVGGFQDENHGHRPKSPSDVEGQGHFCPPGSSSTTAEANYGITEPFPTLFPFHGEQGREPRARITVDGGKARSPRSGLRFQGRDDNDHFQILHHPRTIQFPLRRAKKTKHKFQGSNKNTSNVFPSGGQKIQQVPSTSSDTFCSREDSDLYPRLTLTESSEESWFDLPEDKSDNPFLNDSFYECSDAKKKTTSFLPIDKVGVQTRQSRVLVRKPIPSYEFKGLASNPPVQQQRETSKKSSTGPTAPIFRGEGRCFDPVPQGSSKNKIPTNTNTGRVIPTTPVGKGKLKECPSDTEHIHIALSNLKITKKNRKSPYEKYVVMIKSGSSVECIMSEMARDKVDPYLIDLVSQSAAGSHQ